MEVKKTMSIFGRIGIAYRRNRKIKKYLRMNIEEMKKLSDDELYDVISTLTREEDIMQVNEYVSNTEGVKRIFYVVDYFNMEILNGGLCQFFVNESKDVAPYVMECLNMIGALQYEKLFREFTEKHKIDLNELTSFEIDEVEEYEEQMEKYPFEEFDDLYYELDENEPLEELLIKYVKLHLEEFVFTK